MYKILIADNDNRTVESIERILEQFFDVSINIKSARTGRQAIELAETFCPDIVFVELQIPGINGIEVMREIRNIHQNVNMVIVSACAKFDYAKDAIKIGVLDYISKPFQEEHMIKVLREIFLKVDGEKKKRSLDLEIKEKKEIITPILENNLIYSFLDEKIEKDEIDYFCSLLGIEENAGYFMVLQFEDVFNELQKPNLIKTDVCLKKEYMEIKYIIKNYFQCLTSTIRENRIMIFVPQKQVPLAEEYDFSIQIIEKARKMVQELKRNFRIKFKVGIGRIYERYSLSTSYEEARSSVEYNTTASVMHISDLPVLGECVEHYPIDTEKQLLKSVENGNLNEAIYYVKRLFDWMIRYYENHTMDTKIKALEYVLRAELIGFENGDMTQHFTARGKYLEELIEIQTFQELQNWFEGKIIRVCKNIHMKKVENHSDVIKRAKQYIKLNYAKEIDLDEVSKYLQISPYYFSKLFKKKTGKNFIEYLTQVRMEHAKTLLTNSSKSMKEICMEIGYCDANYFSRIFKKNVGVSPTEYKEEKCGA